MYYQFISHQIYDQCILWYIYGHLTNDNNNSLLYKM